jgi:hypothetical protein
MADEMTYGQRVFLENLNFLMDKLPDFITKDYMSDVILVAVTLTGFEVESLLQERENGSI